MSITATDTCIDVTVDVVTIGVGTSVDMPSVSIGVPGPPGPPGPDGPVGPQGPPGGAVISGWWNYATATSPPPGGGNVLTTPASPNVGDTVTVYLSATDADGLYWTGLGATTGDTLQIRGTQGGIWGLDIVTNTVTVPGATGYNTILATLTGVAGTPAKGGRAQVSLIRDPAAGPAGPPGPQGPPGDPSNYTWFVVVNPATDVRPSFAHVMWVGGSTKPVNMAAGDLWVKGP